ncbi:hypothetical protein BB559_002295 [Furculomyces boomerangus]|uniref:Zinc finger ZPR1-type domain-containing protein n=2 Tax=Harpellales TaxID=61421 RepID=A0A2T9YWF3_9FUNG|nr:hypothetical protein BB559_002295 [Furculomyces boomerangus]PWA02872.1 hypothetical protein BB558_000967 [Smittium angustum]
MSRPNEQESDQISKKLKAEAPEPIFVDINEDIPVTEIESVCMQCYKNGTTRIMLTKIPHFKDIIVMAFECPHCNYRNNEVQSGESIAEKGQKWFCTIKDQKDLARQIVRHGSAKIEIPEIQLELPHTGSTKLTTIEGLLSGIIEDLKQDQETRKEIANESYVAIEKILTKLESYSQAAVPFTLIIDDPSGNSYIESLEYPRNDEKISIKTYTRTKEQETQLGLATEDNPEDTEMEVVEPVEDHINPDEVIVFSSNCSSCNMPSDTRMKQLEIPHFKNVILMSTTCESCGYKSNEVKSGGAIMEKGTRITLTLEDSEDLSRDILKSETCGLEIPEIDLHLTFGTLGGRFTTIEGLLRQVYDDLDRDAPFSGDSSTESRRQTFAKFLSKLKDVYEGRVFPLTLILDDPVSNSYLQNPYAPDEDPNMVIEQYERTFEQNEDLGLNDIKIENYNVNE